jgi:hypothetical protein
VLGSSAGWCLCALWPSCGLHDVCSCDHDADNNIDIDETSMSSLPRRHSGNHSFISLLMEKRWLDVKYRLDEESTSV